MKEHTWVVESVDCGPVGVNDFWTCTGCGAGGGPLFTEKDTKPRWEPFIEGDGHESHVSPDCDEAKLQIEAFKAAPVSIA